MSAIAMKALEAFPYAGRDLVAGDPFTAWSEDDARTLELIGRASREAKLSDGQQYQTRDMIAADRPTRRGKISH